MYMFPQTKYLINQHKTDIHVHIQIVFSKSNGTFSRYMLLYINMSHIKRICVFEHSVMTNFNCACSAIQRGQGSGFLSEGSS